MKASSFLLGALLLPGLSVAQSAFVGTWRPDPEKPSHPAAPEALILNAGTHDCERCKPPYKVPADGQDHPVADNPFYETIRVSATDNHTVTLVGPKGGATVLETKMTVSADGKTLTEVQTITSMMPVPIEMTRTSARATDGPKGSHAVSGTWAWTETDVTNKAEDTTYTMHGDQLSMSDHMGRSFSAKFDGTRAPYNGDPAFTEVSLKMLDSRTLEETDLKDGKPVKISLWTLDSDGKSIHARFDDTHGHIQNQTGHKIE